MAATVSLGCSITTEKVFCQTRRRSFIAIAATLPFTAQAADAPLKIGSPAGPFGDILDFAIERAHAQGLEVKKIEFTDWITPNEALAAGDIDANLFQHIPFLNAAIKARGYKLEPIAATTVMRQRTHHSITRRSPRYIRVS